MGGKLGAKIQSLKELIDGGYGITGLNYPCGCFHSVLFKNHEVVERYEEFCGEHKPKDEEEPKDENLLR